jgi:hypothetical protein
LVGVGVGVGDDVGVGGAVGEEVGVDAVGFEGRGGWDEQAARRIMMGRRESLRVGLFGSACGMGMFSYICWCGV